MKKDPTEFIKKRQNVGLELSLSWEHLGLREAVWGNLDIMSPSGFPAVAEIPHVALLAPLCTVHCPGLAPPCVPLSSQKTCQMLLMFLIKLIKVLM